MGCGAGVEARPEPSKSSETYELEGTYAKAIIDDRAISIFAGDRSLHRVEVKKYKDSFSTKLHKFDQEVALLDGIRSEVFAGEGVGVPYKISSVNEDLLKSGVETHVLLHPHNGPPERFVVGYTDSPKHRCRVRHDDPSRTAIMNLSPKEDRPKLVGDPCPWNVKKTGLWSVGLKNDEFIINEREKSRRLAEKEASMDWQTLEHQVIY